ncbi:hypothetical protein HJG44_04315 [Enterovirga sp. DB1703]|uniref:O-methyltransferase n=1 Tax=Enterovirga aerilata TaxID=2730920 RepID=A0A849ICH2_9HYPH|nr:hypothetical protein [Enterovirga sp. DB1703]
MTQMITGFWVTQIVRGAAMFGYADHLRHGPASAEAIAEAEGLDAAATFRHLRACVTLGLVAHDGCAFRTTPLLETLRRDDPRSLRALALSQAAPGHWLSWGRFTDALRTGERQTVPALGAEIFDYFAQHPTEAGDFTEAMSSLSAAVAGEVARVLDVVGIERVVDVGGAAGRCSSRCLRSIPAFTGQSSTSPA